MERQLCSRSKCHESQSQLIAHVTQVFLKDILGCPLIHITSISLETELLCKTKFMTSKHPINDASLGCDTKGTFHAKMGSIKDRNGLDITEGEDIKKRWQEYTEELYKKDLHDPDNHNGMTLT